MNRLSPVPLLLVTVAAVGIAGCDTTGGAEPGSVAQVDTLPNGAVRVTNPEGAGLWAEGGGWRLTEDLRIGSIDGSGPAVFGRLGGIGVDGRILDIGIRQGTRSRQALVRVDPLTLAADTFPLPSYDGGAFSLLYPDGSPRMSISIPFAGRLIWNVDPRGQVRSAITDHYRIVAQTLAGDTLRIVERTVRPISVTATERAEALENLEYFIREGGEVDASRIPSTKPLINDFLIDDLDYLWVWTQHKETDGVTYDIFDPDGIYLGVVGSPAPLMMHPRPVFQGDHVYGFTLDDLDVPYLVRLRIEGRVAS